MSDRNYRGWKPPERPEEWLAYLVGGAAALYITCSLPAVLGPSSLLGAFGLLLTGVVLGIALVLGGVALLCVLLTKKPKPAALDVQNGKNSSGAKDTARSKFDEHGDRQQQHDSVVQEMLKGAERRDPPHGRVVGGSYNGCVWTIPSSKYDEHEAIVNWPPATEGPKAVATKWWASMRDGTLYLARASGLEKSYLVPVEEVDVSGCQVEVLRKALKTKSRWWRKCPIQVCHPDRQLLHGETSIALFAEGSAAKEQWYAALKQAAGSAPARQAVETTYATFCARARAAGEATRYPQVSEELGRTSAGLVPPPAHSGAAGQTSSKEGPHNKGWGRLFTKRKSSAKPLSAGSPPSRSQSPIKMTTLPQGFLNPMELDQAWMGKGSIPGHLAAPAANFEGGHPSDVQGSKPAPGAGDPACGEGSSRLPATSSDTGLDRKSAVTERAERLKFGSKSLHFPITDETEQAGADSEDASSECGSMSHGGDSPQAGLPQVQPHRPQLGEAEGLPSVHVEHGVNMMLARLSFDILRSPGFKAQLQARIHRKLNELRVPDYIHGFEVVDIDIGSSAPAIRNLRALPTPDATIWPQLMFDLDYEGEITAIIETKLDVRDGAAWSQFDKAINRLEGGPDGGGGAMEAAGNAPLPPPLLDDSDEAFQMSSPALSPTEASKDEGKGSSAQKKGFMANMMPLRQRFAKGIRQLAEVTADHLSRMQLRLRLDIKTLKGPLYVWLPPPPGDRLWFSFVTPPQLVAVATPLVGGRLLKYSYQASRVSQWIAGKLQSSITKNMVFPSCSDIPLPFLLGLDHPDVGFVPPALRPEGEGGSPKAVATPAVSGDGKGEEEPLPEAAAVVSSPPADSSARLAGTASGKLRSPTAAGVKSPALRAPLERSPSAKQEKGAASSKKGFWVRKKSGRLNTSQKSLKTAPKSSEEAALELRDLTKPQPQQAGKVSEQGAGADTAEVAARNGTPLSMGDREALASGRLSLAAEGAEGQSTAPPPLQRAPSGVAEAARHGDAVRTTSALEDSATRSAERDAADFARYLGTEIGESRKSTERSLAGEEPSLPAADDVCPVGDAAQPGSGADGCGRNKQAADQACVEAVQIRAPSVAATEADLQKSAAMFGESHDVEEPGRQSRSTSAEASLLRQEAQGTAPAPETMLTQQTPADGWLGESKEVLEASHPLAAAESTDALRPGGSPSDLRWTPADEFFKLSEPLVGPTDVQPPEELRSVSMGSDRSAVDGILDTARSSLSPTASLEGVSPGRSESGSLRREGSCSSDRPRGGTNNGWQQRLNVTGSVVQKNWEAFKTRNPTTMQQGKKLAGAMEKLRDQAQEQLRRTQEQYRKTQELRKSSRSLGSLPKTNAKEMKDA